MGKLYKAPPKAILPVFFAFILASCAVDLGIEKRDGWPDAEPDVPVDEGDTTDVEEEDGPLPDCGNGTIDDGEDCDGDPPRDCTTTCGSTGTETCIDCRWSECVVPCEECNGGDDDCDDATDESGQFSALEPLRVSDDAASSTRAALAWTGTEIGLTWVDERDGQQDLFSGIVTTEATPTVSVERQFLTASTGILDPAMVWASAGEFVVVATDETAGAGRHVFCQRMDAVGVDAGVIRTVGSIDGTDLHAPDLVERTGGFAVVWDSGFDIHFRLTNAQCNPAGSALSVLEEPADGNVSRDVSIASSGSDFGIVWVDERNGNPQIYAVMASGTGPTCPEFPLSLASAGSEQPDVVWDGSTYAVAWSDGSTDPASISLTRFNHTCTELGDEVQITATSEDATAPSIGWTGSALGVAWQQGGDIYLQVFQDEGHPLICAQEISEGGDSEDPKLVVTDTGFAVAWNDARAGNQEIFLSIVAHEDCP